MALSITDSACASQPVPIGAIVARLFTEITDLLIVREDCSVGWDSYLVV